MDVNKLDFVAPLRGSKDKRERQHFEDHDHPDGHDDGSHMNPHLHEHDVHDQVSVMGIRPEEMTPAVREAINLLLEEIHHLREQLSQSKDHGAYLERHADEHPYLPVFNRRALISRLGQMLSRASGGDTESSFIYLHVGNAEHIRTRLGHGAEEALLRMVVETLRREFGNDTLIGSLDSADFAVILLVTGEDEAREKMNAVVGVLRSAYVVWNGASLMPDILAGLHVFHASDTPEQVLEAADQDLIQRGKQALAG